MISFSIDYKQLLHKVSSRIAPVWPLENFVASNPYWGFRHLPFQDSVKIFLRNGNVSSFMPASYYLEKIHNQEITEDALLKAIHEKNTNWNIATYIHHLTHYSQNSISFSKLPTIAETFDLENNTDVQDIIINETSGRLAVYFDKFGDYFPADENELFQQWHKDATIDLMPELLGLDGFRKYIQQLPEDKLLVFAECLKKLDIEEPYVEEYLHAVLLNLLGWASYLSSVDWDNHLKQQNTHYVSSLLVILLCWEMYLLDKNVSIKEKWKSKLQSAFTFFESQEFQNYFLVLEIAQRALEITIQQKIIHQLTNHSYPVTQKSPKIQMAFCIDVRSEIIRRHIETIDETIETIGIAGFFGFPIQYYPINNEKGKKQCPVLIPSQYKVCEKPPDNHQNTYLLHQKIKDALRYFKIKYRIGVVSGFSYVSPMGLFYLPKLISDSIGITRPYDNPKDLDLKNVLNGITDIDTDYIPLEEKLNMARFTIQALDILKNPASLIVLVGHGSTSVNNPHATSLDCGACGGNSGEINALFGSKILNDQVIREHLKNEGIIIPDNTLFIAAVHDTTTDEIKILREQDIPSQYRPLIDELKQNLFIASKNARTERAVFFVNEEDVNEKNILKRAKDWSQVRPEWGLAGCHSFIIASRNLTKGISLNGKVFLHNYTYSQDKDLSLLENLMTAPMVVASWINLQYYASTVAPEKLGAGNKPLHNPVSGLGVLEGSTGDIKIGLPIQSVHNGKSFQHTPVRLNVFIQAPYDAINFIVQKHLLLQQLIKNNWLYLFVITEKGEIVEYHVTETVA